MSKSFCLTKTGPANQAFQLTSVELPKLNKGELKIEVDAFGLNYADVMCRLGLYKECPALPTVIGYEVVGKVVEQCPTIETDYLNKKVVAFTRFGAYAQHVNTPAYAVAVIEDYDDGKALALATQYVTAFYMSHVVTNVFEGDWVLIHAAAGGVGTALIQMLLNKKVNVIAKIGNENKRDYLKELGVEHIVNYNTVDYSKEVKKILGSSKLDVSFNPVAGSTFKTDMKLLGSNGKLVLFGGSERSGKRWGLLSTLNFVRKMGLLIPIGLMMKSKSVIGVNMLKVADYKPQLLSYCLQSVVEMAKKEEVSPIVGGVFNDDELAKAHDLLESGKSKGKLVVRWRK